MSEASWSARSVLVPQLSLSPLHSYTGVRGKAHFKNYLVGLPRSEWELSTPSTSGHRAVLVYSYRGGKHQHLENIPESLTLTHLVTETDIYHPSSQNSAPLKAISP